jgi:hypothetical protein
MTNLIEQVREQGALFNVRTEEVVSPTGVIAEGKRMIVNEATNRCIGIVSDKYRVVTNEEVLGHLSTALERSNLDMTGLEAYVDQSHGGARAMINVVLPAHEIDLNGDKSRLQISVLNSYDGRWKYQSRAGAIRMACLNGQILGSFVGSYTEYHNAKLDVEAGAQQLINMANDFENAKEWWIQMMGRKVDNEQLLRSIATFLTGKSKIEHREDFLKLPTVRRIIELYETYSAEMGANAYALYNALTDFVTHKKYRDETAAAALLMNQEKLRETLNKSKLFELV